jgi:hypothetical protein
VGREGSVFAQSLDYPRIPELNVQTNEVRCDLLAHSRERRDKSRAELTAEKPGGLEDGAERQRILRLDVKNSVEHDAGECKTLPESLQEL